MFTSPNYPSKYPPDRECIYIIEGEEWGGHTPRCCGWAVSMHRIAVKSGIKLIIEISRDELKTSTLQELKTHEQLSLPGS